MNKEGDTERNRERKRRRAAKAFVRHSKLEVAMVTVDLIKSVRHEEGEWGIEKKDRDRENERQKEQLEQIK